MGYFGLGIINTYQFALCFSRMIEVLVKGIRARGYIATIADKYDDSRCIGPSHRDLILGYNRINRFLHEHSETEKLADEINPFPLIDQGVIGIPAGAACYIWKDFLIAASFKPVQLSVWAAGREEDEETIDKILQWDMKREGEFYWHDCWEDLEPRRVYVSGWSRGEIKANLQELLTS